MSPPPPNQELSSLLKLATPLAVVQLGNQLLGIVDLAVVGRLGQTELAGVGLGMQLYFIASVLGFGVMLGLDPIISQAVGARDFASARRSMWQGVWLSALASVPTIAFTLLASWGLVYLGVTAEVAEAGSAYLIARIPGVYFFLGLAGLRSYLQGRDCTRPLVWGMIIANLINLPASWLLVFGDAGLTRFGMPALGVPAYESAGAGLASSLSSCVQYGIAALAILRLGSPGGAPQRRPSMRSLKNVLRLGLPIGFTILAEAGIFTVVAICIGWFGARPLAAHNVALSMGTTTFQVALAIGAATSVRVGHAVGRGDVATIRRTGFLGLKLGGGVMLLAGLLFWTLPSVLARLITDAPDVIESAVAFIMVCGAFQLVDGLQTVSAGALRGLGDTRAAFITNLCGHYLLGLPVGAFLTWHLNWGPVGLWWGLFVGLTAVSIVLTYRFHRISSRPIAPVARD